MKVRILLGLLFVFPSCTTLKRKLLDAPVQDFLETNPSPPLEENLLVIPALGQSNNLGAGQWDAFEENPRVQIQTFSRSQTGVSNTRRVGPTYALALDIVANNPTAKVLVLQCSVGSSPMSTWVPGGENYEACLEFIAPYKTNIVAFTFYQGEADAGSKTYNHAWPQQFALMVSDFRARVKNVPVVFAQLGQFGRPNANWEPFKEAQATVSLPGVRMVKTDDQPLCDNKVHHGAEANRVIGERFYEALKSLGVNL